MTHEQIEEILLLMDVPDVALAVLIGEGAAALAHRDATGECAFDFEDFLQSFTNATGVWAARRVESGALGEVEASSIDVVIADARAWATAHPAALAQYDQAFAAFRDRIRGD